jgi:integrase
MLHQGCRPDELMSLLQADVDLVRGLLHIRRGKTKAAKRSLKLTAESKAILAARLDGGNWVFKGKRTGTHLTKLNNPLEKVLDAINPCAECGGMISEHRRDEIQRCKKYQRGTVIEFVLYDFRDTFATRMVEAGCSLPALAAILGHSGLRMVMRYVHPQQEHKDAAMLRYEQYLIGRSLVPVPKDRVRWPDFKAVLRQV